MGFLKNAKVFLGFEEEEEQHFELEKKKMPESKIRLNTQKGSLIDFQSINKKSSRKELAQYTSEVVIAEPKSYEDSIQLSSYLKDGKSLVLNLKYLDAPSGKRLIDFVCGTAYAFECHMQKLGGNIFLFTPSNVGIIDEQNNDISFNDFNSEENESHYDPGKSIQEGMFLQTA